MTGTPCLISPTTTFLCVYLYTITDKVFFLWNAKKIGGDWIELTFQISSLSEGKNLLWWAQKIDNSVAELWKISRTLRAPCDLIWPTLPAFHAVSLKYRNRPSQWDFSDSTTKFPIKRLLIWLDLWNQL